MDLLIDVHNHTIISGHAYSTIMEIVTEAKSKGLRLVGITDHGPYMPGVLGKAFISNQHIIPKYINGIEVISGVEANIIDQYGSLDVPEKILRKLDIIIAGLHDIVIKPWEEQENTKALLSTLENKYVDIISHPGNVLFPIDKKAVVFKAKETGKLLELNNGTFYSNNRAGSANNCYEIIRLCKKYEVPIIVGSDSHFALEVGRFDKALEVLQSIDFPEKLVINTSIENFKIFLEKRNKEKQT